MAQNASSVESDILGDQQVYSNKFNNLNSTIDTTVADSSIKTILDESPDAEMMANLGNKIIWETTKVFQKEKEELKKELNLQIRKNTNKSDANEEFYLKNALLEAKYNMKLATVIAAQNKGTKEVISLAEKSKIEAQEKLRDYQNKSIQNLLDVESKPIKHLVFSGGGAKGVLYLGTTKALFENDLLKNIQTIAGASAGSMISALLCCGIEQNDLVKAMNQQGADEMFGQGGLWQYFKRIFTLKETNYIYDGDPIKTFIENATKLATKKCLSPIKTELSNILKKYDSPNYEVTYKDLKKLIQLLPESFKDLDTYDANPHEWHKQLLNFINPFAKKSDEQRVKSSNKDVDIKQIIKTLETDISFVLAKCDSDNLQITFGDLKKLNKLLPQTFKNLKISVVEQKTGEVRHLDWDNSEHVAISDACRASASLPIILKPKKIGDLSYIDGGYYDNAPTDHIPENERMQSLLFIFSDGPSSPVLKALHSSQNEYIFSNFSAKDKLTYDVIWKNVGGVGGDKISSEMYEWLNQKIRNDFPLRTVPLDSSNLSILDTKIAQDNQPVIEMQGYLDTLNFLYNYSIIKPTQYDEEKLQYSNFFFEVFKKYQSKQKDQNKFSILQNGPELLEFANSKTLKLYKIVENYILTATKTTKGQSANSQVIEALIDTLNNNQVSFQIKEKFCNCIDKKYQDIKKVHFEKEDFARFLLSKNYANYIL